MAGRQSLGLQPRVDRLPTRTVTYSPHGATLARGADSGHAVRLSTQAIPVGKAFGVGSRVAATAFHNAP